MSESASVLKPLSMEVRMTGQVILPFPNTWTSGKRAPLAAYVIGVGHKPMLAVPFSNILSVDPILPRLECSYLDSTGKQYVMIDITGYIVSVEKGFGPGGVQRGSLDNVLDLNEVKENGKHPKEEVLPQIGVASKVLLDKGDLDEGDLSTVDAQVTLKTGVRAIGKVAASLVWRIEGETEYLLILTSAITRYTIKLGPFGSESVVLLQLSALCGWNGQQDKLDIDLDAAKTMFPLQLDYGVVKFVAAPKHPGSSKCDPSLVQVS